jgi:hypothetical protein
MEAVVVLHHPRHDGPDHGGCLDAAAKAAQESNAGSLGRYIDTFVDLRGLLG